ncbi:molybdopterin oxidoreductase [Rhodococcus sp. 14-2686-1-2]|nr:MULTISPECIES: molybdopterin-dependent oxidoreductase [unclassified Rhodococcus (in: high G+C Gram-positive bacteria)]OZE93160.1 molybdopterin oxidoreductase [Rhodococcus sp. 15-1189-1-1a]OZF08278.1 molybdopterin oxidoreductase [Rhodococcus sp. 14-2686-1-2]
MGNSTRKISYCRLCPASCGVLLDVVEGRIDRVLGDTRHPISRGYTCAKGRRGGELTHGEGRLRISQRRTRHGRYIDIDWRTAVSEISTKLSSIVQEHGPEAVALFMGTQQNFSALTPNFARAWFKGTGSHKLFSTMTIDQSAKWVVQERMGVYTGGRQRIESSDVWLLAGTNPLVSANGGDGDGAVVHSPSISLREAVDRGTVLIVVDPRLTETAARADIHLAPRPGTDAILFAGLLHVVFVESLQDDEFCDAWVGDLRALVKAVEPVTPALVEDRCGIPAQKVKDAARVFAKARRGMATSGTGVCMGSHSNLTEHLVAALNVVCGRYLREGEIADARSVIARHVPARAEVRPPSRTWERGFSSRIEGVGTMNGELPSGILADEILTPGPDRIRALVVSGGNPAEALQNEARTLEALDSLDLLVVVDPWMSATAARADYVIAPTTMYERGDHTIIMEAFFPVPFAQFTDAVVEPPTGVVDDWRFFFELANASGQEVKFAGRKLTPETLPSARELLAMFTERGRVPFDDLARAEHGMLVPGESTVLPATHDGAAARLSLCPEDVREELEDALARPAASASDLYPLRLTVRRIKEAMNSHGAALPGLVRDVSRAARMSPSDMTAVRVVDGDLVKVSSASGSLRCTVLGDPTLPPGVVSMTHGLGNSSADVGGGTDRPVSANVNALTGSGDAVETINAMPMLTGVPIAVERA